MKRLLILVFLLIFSWGFSQERQMSLSLQEAIDYAIKNSYNNKVAENDIEASQSQGRDDAGPEGVHEHGFYAQGLGHFDAHIDIEPDDAQLTPFAAHVAVACGFLPHPAALVEQAEAAVRVNIHPQQVVFECAVTWLVCRMVRAGSRLNQSVVHVPDGRKAARMELDEQEAVGGVGF